MKTLASEFGRTAYVVLAAALACGRVDVAPLTAARADTIPLRPFFRELRTVTGTLGGQEGQWLFDTGGGVTLITPDVARRAGCTPAGSGVGVRMSGEPVRFQWCQGLSLQLAGMTVRLERIAVLDVNALLPEPLRTLSGVVSLDAFAGRHLTIDWPAARVIASDRTDTAALALPVHLATGVDGTQLTAFTPVAGANGPLWMLLDSGNIEGTIIGQHVVRDGRVPMSRDSTLGVPATRGAARLRYVAKPILYDGVLGTAFFQLGAVSIDLAAKPVR